jgi:tetratricopeptide (TPR) repeat protein
MMILFLLASALAAPPAGTPPSGDAPLPDTPVGLPASDAAPMPPLRDAAQIIDQAIEIRRNGDVDGARSLLLAAEPMMTPELRSRYLYQRGVTEELAWKPEEAKAFYEQVIALGGNDQLDAIFRHAMVLEQLGDDDGALKDILRLAKVRGLDEDDQTTVDLARGISEVNAGRVHKGVKRLNKVLASVEGTDKYTYYRAKARYTLAKALLDDAAKLDLTGGEHRVVRRLKRRADDIKAAEGQVEAVANLKEPEWVLAGLIALGDGYAGLADAVADSTPPRKLSDAEKDVYRQEVAKKAENVRTKAYHAYDSGVALAARIAWDSPRVAILKEKRAALETSR